MTSTVATVVPGLVPELERALVSWLPEQRWFGDKGREISRVEYRPIAELTDRLDWEGPCGILGVADVSFADEESGPPARYQLPLGVRREPQPDLGPALVTTVGGVAVYDATFDRELNSELLYLIGGNQVRDSVRFVAEPSGGLAFANRRSLTGRRNETEQSNTSVIFGDRFILKLFRRMPDRPNPDLELLRALNRAGSRHIAPLLGAVEGELDGTSVTYAMLQSFCVDATDGWKLATADVRKLLSGESRNCTFADDAGTLGTAVAAVHADLAAELGSVELGADELAEISAKMLARLDVALRAAPALRPQAEAIQDMYDSVRSLTSVGSAQRIHGDLHLGQSLRTSTRWVLIDFEGEPAVPLAERVALYSPLRDVAGMLRSFDYAAHHELTAEGREPDPAAAEADAEALRWAGWWVDRATDAFCAGYADRSGVDPREQAGLMCAYELDKAVYEVAYETRNRPAWAELPMRAVRRILGKEAV